MQDTSQYWDSQVATYNKKYVLDSKWSQQKIIFKSYTVVKLLHIYESSNILEIGCGTGIYTKWLSSTLWQLTATDISSGMMNNNTFPKLKNVTTKQEDVHKLSFNSESFDAVVGFYVLQYTNLYISLNQIFRVLKPGGVFAFWECNGLNPVIFALTRTPMRVWTGRDKSAKSYHRWHLEFMLGWVGFEDISIVPYEFVPWYRVNNVLENMPIVKEFAGSLFITARKPC